MSVSGQNTDLFPDAEPERAIGDALDRTLGALRHVRIMNQDLPEADLQATIERTLTGAGIAYQREYRLGQGFIDFLCEDGVGIEVKRGRPHPPKVIQQVERYLGYPEVRGVIVAVERSLPIPEVVAGKPARMWSINSNWGLAP